MADVKTNEMAVKTENRPVQDQKRQPVVMTPPVDIYETEEGILLLADMPGVPKENLDVHVDKNQLTIKGKIGDIVPKDINPLYVEFNGKAFEREFTLGPDVDVSKIEASMNAGVLKIFLPKSEEVRPRKIEVTVE
ncbi:MAG: Hsp20/alpha crystallin family protein [Thermodesulfatator sp.]|nr:MAG: Hsp20/alpha crystallin family protein [Thermodesulfatator sp.]